MDAEYREFVDGVWRELGWSGLVNITASDVERLIDIINELEDDAAQARPNCPTCHGWGWVPVKVGEDDVITEPCPVCEDFYKGVAPRHDNCGYTRDW